jgi:pyruvate,orthophosphate dikinase
MQVRAIVEAAVDLKKRGLPVSPEIMIPLTMDATELQILEKHTRAVVDTIIQESGVQLKYLFGTMVETPRAAITADRIAEVAEFFSFGTNDLTQMLMGLSRDDAGRFLPHYWSTAKTRVFHADPFQTLDQDGVGRLIAFAIERGRSMRPKLKVGICGEHGGDPESIRFCHRANMDYVSCSPYRVPIARLAAAQAAIEEDAAEAPRRRKPLTGRKSAKPTARQPARKTTGRVVKKKAPKKASLKSARRRPKTPRAAPR